MSLTIRDFIQLEIQKRAKRDELISQIASNENMEKITEILLKKEKTGATATIDFVHFKKYYPYYLDTILQNLRASSQIKNSIKTSPSDSKSVMIDIHQKLKEVDSLFLRNPETARLFGHLESSSYTDALDVNHDQQISDEICKPAIQEKIDSFFDSIYPTLATEPKVLEEIRKLIRGLEFVINHDGDEWVNIQRFGQHSTEVEILYSIVSNTPYRGAYVISFHLIELAKEIGLVTKQGQGDFISICSQHIDASIGEYIKNLGQLAINNETARSIVKTIHEHLNKK